MKLSTIFKLHNQWIYCACTAVLTILLLARPLAYAAPTTVDVIGEAQIISNDLASAKLQAEARAKWAAMEKASQVKLSVDTVIHNAEMLDEMVKSTVSATIIKYELIDEGKDGDIYWVQAKVTVEPDKAAALLTKNTTLAVYLPMIKADGSVQESHPFSETVINQLIDKGFDVIDFSSLDDPKLAAELLEATQKNNMSRVRSLVSQYTAGSALVGTVKVLDKGKNVGYTNITFTIVDGEVNYRILAARNGQISILNSGSMTGRGQGATDENAAHSLSTSLSKRNASMLANEAATKILGANKKTIRIALVGNTDIQKYNEFRDTIKNTSFVLNLKEINLSTVLVDYPEKTLYLATLISNNGYKIKEFTDNEILILPK